MTTLNETAYPCIKPDPTARELAELYTPSEDERILVAATGKRPLGIKVEALICAAYFCFW